MEGNFKIVNSLSGRKEVFKSREPNKVFMYACGLTPQDAPHIGHIRGAIVMDVLRRWLEEIGYDVNFVQNFTDIDDKIINRMKLENISAEEVANKYSKLYEDTLNNLGVKPINFVRVTSNMTDIVDMVAQLVEKNHAYVVDGDVYYSVESFKEYGKLSKRNPDDMQSGSRIDVDERKRNPMDFALWKSAKPGEPSWDSPWGMGRPGWHIECSTLSLKYLGANFDIHAGGTDLIFPHHENEIAQSEAYLDHHPFCQYWMHWGAIRSGGEKMSKSLGNDAKINTIIEKYSPDTIRLYLLGTSYRSPIEFSLERMDEAQTALNRIRRVYDSLNQRNIAYTEIATAVKNPLWTKFSESMNDDMNTAAAMASVFEAVSGINKLLAENGTDNSSDMNISLTEYGCVLNKMLTTLGFMLEDSNNNETSDTLNQLMDKVIGWRAMLRQSKQFAVADAIRDDLKEIGISIEDGPRGTTWRKNG